MKNQPKRLVYEVIVCKFQTYTQDFDEQKKNIGKCTINIVTGVQIRQDIGHIKLL